MIGNWITVGTQSFDLNRVVVATRREDQSVEVYLNGGGEPLLLTADEGAAFWQGLERLAAEKPSAAEVLRSAMKLLRQTSSELGALVASTQLGEDHPDAKQVELVGRAIGLLGEAQGKLTESMWWDAHREANRKARRERWLREQATQESEQHSREQSDG